MEKEHLEKIDCYLYEIGEEAENLRRHIEAFNYLYSEFVQSILRNSNGEMGHDYLKNTVEHQHTLEAIVMENCIAITDEIQKRAESIKKLMPMNTN